METCGGARVDCEAGIRTAGLTAGDSRRRASTLLVPPGTNDGCRFAHCGVLTARQQS